MATNNRQGGTFMTISMDLAKNKNSQNWFLVCFIKNGAFAFGSENPDSLIETFQSLIFFRGT